MEEIMVEEKKEMIEQQKLSKERKLLDRKPKVDIEEKEEEKEEGKLPSPKPKRERKPPAGETDYGWCDEEELPSIETTFDENEEIIHEKTNRKVIK